MFSLPLLYTMEMWWAGFTSQPERLLLYIAATFALLIGYNRYAGMRQDASWVEVAIDSVEEMGLGLVTAGLMLFLLGRITSEMELTGVDLFCHQFTVGHRFTRLPAYTAVTTGKSPAHIALQLGPTQERGGKFFIQVVAENRGEQTAEGVYVEVVLKANGKEERGMFVIDRLPRRGKRRGIVTFETDPRLASTVEARALGYAEP